MRGLLIAAVFAGASYCLSAWGVIDAGALTPAWKTSGVGFLALWAATQAKSTDGWLITAVMAFGALGDLFLDTHGLIVGAVFFAIGHIIAWVLYLRNRRAVLSPSQKLLGWLLAPLTVLIAALLATPEGTTGMLQAGGYSAFLGIMAALAWTSNFPRYRVGLGAVLFVLSDLFIFWRVGALFDPTLPALLVWPTYFAGQALIAWGVVTALKERAQA